MEGNLQLFSYIKLIILLEVSIRMLHFLLSSLGYKIQYLCTFFALDADTCKILMFLPFNIPGFILLKYYSDKIPSRIWVRMFIGFLTSNVTFGVLLGETTLFETFPFLMDCFLIPYVFVVFYLHSTSFYTLQKMLEQEEENEWLDLLDL